MLAICSFTFTHLCVDFYFLLLIVSAFCKRLSDMTMYMWLITLQKKAKHSGSGFYLWFGFWFFLGRFLLGYGSLWPFVIRSKPFQNENQDHECLILTPSNIFGSQRVPIWILVYRCFSGLGALKYKRSLTYSVLLDWELLPVVTWRSRALRRNKGPPPVEAPPTATRAVCVCFRFGS